MKKIYFFFLSFLMGVAFCFLSNVFLLNRKCSFLGVPQKYKYDSVLTPKQFLQFYAKGGRLPNFSTPKNLIMFYDSRFLEFVLKKYPNVGFVRFGLTGPLNVFYYCLGR